MRATRVRSLVAGHWSLVFALACSGCAYQATETNYFTIEHAFTDAAAARALRDAEKLCAQKRLAAVRTTGACSLERCTSHYQCMTKDDADNYKN